MAELLGKRKKGYGFVKNVHHGIMNNYYFIKMMG